MLHWVSQLFIDRVFSLSSFPFLSAKTFEKISTCHMTLIQEIAGTRYNRLTLIRRVENSKDGRVKWLCSCECGTERAYDMTSVRSGHTKSCGCLRAEMQPALVAVALKQTRLRRPEETAYNRRSLECKRGARERGLTWKLTREQAIGILDGMCSDCGAKPANRTQTPRIVLFYNGIDRVDNLQGYERGNVVSACSNCNVMKNNHSLQDLKVLVDNWTRYFENSNFEQGEDDGTGFPV